MGTESVGDIVVTAQRRSERLQDVPISIAAMSQVTLDRKGVRDIADVARMTPGLAFTQGDTRSSGINNIAIRGISSTGGSPTTGIYLDDTPIQARKLGYTGGVGTAFPRVFDLERTEVLRGPQGTLFGASSQGGAVRFITPRPSLTATSLYGRAELSTTAHGSESYEAGLAFGSPLVTDMIGLRVSGWYRHDGGYVDRADQTTGAITEKDTNSANAYSFRAALAIAPTSNLTITPSIFFQREKSQDGNAFWEPLSNVRDGRFRNGNAIKSPTLDRFYVASLRAELDFEHVSLYSVTSYFNREQEAVTDYSTLDRAVLVPFGLLPSIYPPAGAAGTNIFTNTQKNFTQEVRLQSRGSDRFNWVIGAFYQRAQQNAKQYDYDPTLAAEVFAFTGLTIGQIFGTDPIDGTIFYRQDPYRTVDEQISGFAQVDWEVIPKLTLTAGMRVAHTTFKGSVSVSGPYAGPAFSDTGATSENPVTPKFGIAYDFTPDHKVYASATKGYRVGGFNPRQVSLCQADLDALGIGGDQRAITSYKSDSVWSYEAGSKNRLMDGKLSADASVYYVKWNDIQQFVPLPGCAGGFIGNLGRAVNKGFDLTLSLRPVSALSIDAAVGYNDGKFKETVFGGPVQTPGRSLASEGDAIPNSPWQVSLGSQYDVDIGSYPSYFRADYQFSSRQSQRVPASNPNNGLSFNPFYYGLPETHLVSLRAGVRLDNIDISAFVNNLLDSHTVLVRQNDVPSAPLFRIVTQRPRTIGITAVIRR